MRDDVSTVIIETALRLWRNGDEHRAAEIVAEEFADDGDFRRVGVVAGEIEAEFGQDAGYDFTTDVVDTVRANKFREALRQGSAFAPAPVLSRRRRALRVALRLLLVAAFVLTFFVAGILIASAWRLVTSAAE